jgi:hypothetical protein
MREELKMATVNEAIEFAKTHPLRFREYMVANPADQLVVFLTDPVNKLTEEFVNRMGLYYLRDGMVELAKTVEMQRKIAKHALRTFKYAKGGKVRRLFLRDYVSYCILSKQLKELTIG